MASGFPQGRLEKRSRSITRPGRTWLSCRAASREIPPTRLLSCWSWPITRPLAGESLTPFQVTRTTALRSAVDLTRGDVPVDQRRTTSRLVGENGLYVGGGMEEMTGSPGSSNSGDRFLHTCLCSSRPSATFFLLSKCVERISSSGPNRLTGLL